MEAKLVGLQHAMLMVKGCVVFSRLGRAFFTL